jgi:hypothetical protein
MTYEGFGNTFGGDFADTCMEKSKLMSIEGRAEGIACPDPVTRTPIGVCGNHNVSADIDGGPLYLLLNVIFCYWMSLSVISVIGCRLKSFDVK